jgi:hypothetical protein
MFSLPLKGAEQGDISGLMAAYSQNMAPGIILSSGDRQRFTGRSAPGRYSPIQNAKPLN